MEPNDANVDENEEAPCQVFKLTFFESCFVLMGVGFLLFILFSIFSRRMMMVSMDARTQKVKKVLYGVVWNCF